MTDKPFVVVADDDGPEVAREAYPDFLNAYSRWVQLNARHHNAYILWTRPGDTRPSVNITPRVWRE